MGKVLFFLLLLFLPLLLCSKKPIIDFYQEKITIEIDSASALVRGEYFFANNTNTRKIVRFFYPFPVDSIHSFPDIIILNQPYERDTNGIHFSMLLEPGRNNSFKISYRQYLKKRYFCYIITTTRKWQKPIKYAEFIVFAKKNQRLHLSYPPAAIFSRGEYDCYKIVKREFYPAEDLVIQW
ncbi:MAG: hypothetical protein ABIL40_01485 [candidate division WOR-3 bacterium]